MTSIRNRLQFSPHWIALIDIAAIAAWGVLLLDYWINQKLTLLIHPNYIPLSVTTGFLLIAIAVYRIWTLLQIRKSKQPLPAVEHLSILPPGIGSLLLLAVAILGLLITPKAFASQTALQRGVGDVVTLTQVKPQSFRVAAKPEQRTIIDWMRTLQVSPEPDLYNGQKVRVQGFVVHHKELPPEYFRITRFIVTCCAADAGRKNTEVLDNRQRLLGFANLQQRPNPVNGDRNQEEPGSDGKGNVVGMNQQR